MAENEESQYKKKGEVDSRTRPLTNKQEKAIMTVLITGGTIEEGVRKAAISKASFYSWLKNPAFKSKFEEMRKEMVGTELHQLKMAVGQATKVLIDLLEAESDAVKIKAALGILEHVGRFMSIEDVERRLTELELKIK